MGRLQLNVVKINKDEVGEFLQFLSEIGRVGQTGVTRLAYTEDWVAAMQYCQQFAKKNGLEVSQDELGNISVRLEGKTKADTVSTGSHIDTQINGGRYDGALGVVGGLISLKALKEQFGQPQKTIETIIFCEEEGSRFPNAGFWGSRGIVGKIRKEDLVETLSFDGKLIRDCMIDVRLKPDRFKTAIRDKLGAFIELHIEQGPLLEENNLSVGLVTSITGMAQFEVILEGKDNHAGTCPMDMRIDPMSGFAEISLALLDQAHQLGRPYVTTIGQVFVEPGGVAIIPKRIRFSIDARHPDPKLRKEFYAIQDKVMRDICDRRGLSYSRKCLLDIEPCESDKNLINVMKVAAGELGLQTRTVESGAGHDAQQISEISPVAMIFVRSAHGVSHTPDEFSTLSDCTAGVSLLAQTLYNLAYKPQIDHL